MVQSIKDHGVLPSLTEAVPQKISATGLSRLHIRRHPHQTDLSSLSPALLSILLSLPLLEYAPENKACKAYRNLAEEVTGDES